MSGVVESSDLDAWIEERGMKIGVGYREPRVARVDLLPDRMERHLEAHHDRFDFRISGEELGRIPAQGSFSPFAQEMDHPDLLRGGSRNWQGLEQALLGEGVPGRRRRGEERSRNV